MTTKLVLDDGTFLVPHEIPEGDKEYEKALLDAAKYDEAYKDAKHRPFIDDVRINNRKFRALLAPATREGYDEFMRNEDRAQKEEAYYKRCPISDGKGKIKQCPPRIPNPNYRKIPGATKTVKNRCDICPIARAGRDKRKFASLEDMLYNDAGEEIDRREISTGMVSRGDLADRVRDILLDMVVDKHSRYAEVVRKMLDENMNIKQICDEMELNPSGVYKGLGSKFMREDVLAALEDDPLVEIEKLLY